MSDQPIDKLLTICREDSLSIVDAYALVDGLAEMVKQAALWLEGCEYHDELGNQNRLAADLLAKLEAKE